MNPKEKNEKTRYLRFIDELSKLLYEEDPAIMGSKIAAPVDEYEPAAARIATQLRRTDARTALEMVFPGANITWSLVERIQNAARRFDD